MGSISPTCPHCNYEFDEEETWYGTGLKCEAPEHGDGDISELTCPNSDCEKKFHVACYHDVKFKACDEDGQDLI